MEIKKAVTWRCEGKSGWERWGRRRGTVKKKNKEVKGGEQKNVMVVNIWRVE